MNSSILVSVIIPVYNVEPYLDEAINSVIQQTYGNLEIIIIDDGSTDGSGKRCDYYAAKDSRIVVFHQENRGLSSARNAGLDHATGEIVSFLDPDDAFRPEMIQTLLQEMLRYQADIAVCGFFNFETEKLMTFGADKEAKTESVVVDRNEVFLRIVERQIDTAVWNRLYKREVWENLRFPDGHVYEGTFTVFDIFGMARKIVLLDEKLVLHRIRPGSICRTSSLKNLQDSFDASERYYTFVKSHSPEIFSEQTLLKLMRTRVRGSMGTYLNYICNNPGDIRGRQLIKGRLIDIANEVGLNRCRIPIRLGYYLVLFFPDFSSILYRFYRKVKALRSRPHSG